MTSQKGNELKSQAKTKQCFCIVLFLLLFVVLVSLHSAHLFSHVYLNIYYILLNGIRKEKDITHEGVLNVMKDAAITSYLKQHTQSAFREDKRCVTS